MLDLDDTTLDRAETIARQLTKEYPQAGSCLIFESSQQPQSITIRYRPEKPLIQQVKRSSYHLVFDNQIGYNTVCRICETLSALDVVEPTFQKMRSFRGDLTLRVSPTQLSDGEKPAPKIASYVPNLFSTRSDGLILRYLRFSSDAFFALQQHQQQSHRLHTTSNQVTAKLHQQRKPSTIQCTA